MTKGLTLAGKVLMVGYAFNLAYYVVISFVYFRRNFITLTMVVLLFLFLHFILYIRKGKRLPLTAFRVFYCYLLMSAVSLFFHFRGPGNDRCNVVMDSHVLTPILTAEQVTTELGLSDCFPYDLVYDEFRDVLITTWKEQSAGYYDPSSKKVHNAFIKITLHGGDNPTYQVLTHTEDSLPDDLTIAQDISTAFALAQSVDPATRNAYFALDYGENRFAVTSRRTLPGEPNAIYYDPDQKEIYVMLFHGELLVYQWPNNEFLRSIPIPSASNILWMSVLDQKSLAYFSAASGGFSQVNLKTGESRISKRLLPIKAHEYDPVTDSFYVSGMMEHSLWQVDRQTLTFKRRYPIGFCAHFLYLDPHREILYLGDYSGGSLAAFSLTSHRIIARMPTGTLLRNIAFSQKRDRLFVGSGCGIFEVSLDKWLKNIQ